LLAGKGVFVEKPLASTSEECDQMMAAAARAGRVLSVNHSARMDPVVLRGLQLLEQGSCGEVLAVDFCRSSDYPLYAGGPMPAPFRQGGYLARHIEVMERQEKLLERIAVALEQRRAP